MTPFRRDVSPRIGIYSHIPINIQKRRCNSGFHGDLPPALLRYFWLPQRDIPAGIITTATTRWLSFLPSARDQTEEAIDGILAITTLLLALLRALLELVAQRLSNHSGHTFPVALVHAIIISAAASTSTGGTTPHVLELAAVSIAARSMLLEVVADLLAGFRISFSFTAISSLLLVFNPIRSRLMNGSGCSSAGACAPSMTSLATGKTFRIIPNHHDGHLGRSLFHRVGIPVEPPDLVLLNHSVLQLFPRWEMFISVRMLV